MKKGNSHSLIKTRLLIKTEHYGPYTQNMASKKRNQ